MSIDLNTLQWEVAAWAEETFPNSTPETIREHLRREAVELQQAIEAGEPVLEEVCDIVLIALHYARRRGHRFDVMLENKFAICRARQWGEPDAQGVVEHVREPER